MAADKSTPEWAACVRAQTRSLNEVLAYLVEYTGLSRRAVCALAADWKGEDLVAEMVAEARKEDN